MPWLCYVAVSCLGRLTHSDRLFAEVFLHYDLNDDQNYDHVSRQTSSLSLDDDPILLLLRSSSTATSESVTFAPEDPRDDGGDTGRKTSRGGDPTVIIIVSYFHTETEQKSPSPGRHRDVPHSPPPVCSHRLHPHSLAQAEGDNFLIHTARCDENVRIGKSLCGKLSKPIFFLSIIEVVFFRSRRAPRAQPSPEADRVRRSLFSRRRRSPRERWMFVETFRTFIKEVFQPSKTSISERTHDISTNKVLIIHLRQCLYVPNHKPKSKFSRLRLPRKTFLPSRSNPTSLRHSTQQNTKSMKYRLFGNGNTENVFQSDEEACDA